MQDGNGMQNRRRFKSVYVLYGLLILGSIYLIIYHGPHLYTILPFLFVLLCPLMHLMHGGHHGNHEESETEHKHSESDHDKEHKH